MENLKHNLSGYFSLFTSLSTLICCALPTLLVILGLGAVVASTVSAFPALITLSENKDWIFSAAFIGIAVNFYLLYLRGRKSCKVTPAGGRETPCETASRWNKIVFWSSAGILFVGFFVAYLGVPVLKFFESI